MDTGGLSQERVVAWFPEKADCSTFIEQINLVQPKIESHNNNSLVSTETFKSEGIV